MSRDSIKSNNNNLLITGLAEFSHKNARSKHAVKIEEVPEEVNPSANLYANQQLPVILEKSKENFMKHMINVETKFANLGQIEDYYSTKIDKVNIKYNRKADIIQQKKKQIIELEQKISNEVAIGNKIETGDINIYYDKIINQINTKM